MNERRTPGMRVISCVLLAKAMWGLGLVLMCFLATQGLAETPEKINYQGLLTDTDTGDPLEGPHTMTFRIFDQVEDGAELWSESQMVDVGPTGLFAVILGSTNPIDLPFSTQYWLGVEVAGEILTPRRELVSVPYAFRSMTAGDADSLGGVRSGDYLVQGETGVVTSDMIEDGPGSGLDADMLDGLDSDAFADSGHSHDDSYYTQDTLHTAGSINSTANPVDWTKLKSVPAGFADGTDDTGPGDGHSLDADDGNPVDALYVGGAGRVGIGTTNPTRGQLEVATTTGVGIYSTSSDSAGIVGSLGTLAVPEMNAGIVAIGETWNGLSAFTGQAAAAAVYAKNLAGGPAIWANNPSGDAPCINAYQSGSGAGIFGQSEYGQGVYGRTNSWDGIGVGGYGVSYSVDDFPDAYWTPGGFFAGRNGLVAFTEHSGGTAIVGRAVNSEAWAAVFTSFGNGVNILAGAGKTGLSVFGGSKSAVVETDSGRRQLYCEESSEVWFTDYGFGQLEQGTAVVAIDPIFAQTVNLNEPYHVFIQVYGDADVYVAERTREAFEVSLRDGDASAEFSYRLIAKRKGFEGDRLAIFQDTAVLQQTSSESE